MFSVPSVVNPLLALGFANLAVLGWLAAAAAPILIHLWMRQTHRETAWAAVRFLRAALEKQARRLRLQHWLLLAVRTLLLLLVVLAAAKPLLESGLLGGGVPTHRVLIVDASLSMSSVSSDGETALDRAKRLAIASVDGGRTGDTYSLVVMGADAGAPLGRPTADAGATRRAIEAVAPSQGVADVSHALATVRGLIDSEAESASGRRQEVVFFSDLGENSWSPLTDENGRELYTQLDESAELSVFDVGGSTVPNAAVTSVVLAEGLPTLTMPVEVRGEAQLFAGETSERVAELLVDGQAVAERRVTLSRDRPTPIDFVHAFDGPGPRAISVRLASKPGEADRLAADNERFLAVTLRPRVRVLCVAGVPGAADYLADALDPTGEGVFEPVIVSDADLPTIDLGQYVCVFLSNVRELSVPEAGRLRAYAERGGGVAIFLGDRVNPRRYNETLAPPRQAPGDTVGTLRGEPLTRVSAESESIERESAEEPPEGLMPGWLSPSVAVPSYRVDPLDYTHPIVRPFRGQERAGLLTTPVLRHFPLTVPESSTATVALELENGDPLLVTGVVGRGRVALITTAATLDSVDPATGQAWTALPAWPSFLPIVRELVRYLANDSNAGTALTVGEPISGRVAEGLLGEVVIESPEASTNRAEAGRVTPDGSGEWTFNGARTAGVYRYGPADEAPTGAVAINLDPAESDPTTVATDRLPESLTVRRTAGDATAEKAATAAPTPIHRWLLYGALALALIEPAMACLFGRGSG